MLVHTVHSCSIIFAVLGTHLQELRECAEGALVRLNSAFPGTTNDDAWALINSNNGLNNVEKPTLLHKHSYFYTGTLHQAVLRLTGSFFF